MLPRRGVSWLHTYQIVVIKMKPLFAALIAFVACFGAVAFAQNFDDLRAAGNGIDINANGRVIPLSSERSDELGRAMQRVMEPVPASLDRRVTRRAISLKRLDAEVNRIVEQQEFLPDSIRYFGGLTSIDYIVLVPEENDILLVGPAEGWRADAAGNIVGTQSGLPVLIFEDFLTALRVWNRPNAPQAVSGAFEPTAEMQARLTRLHRQLTNINANNAAAYAAALEEAHGDVPVVIAGVPASSRFARILVAADFTMKRIAFGLEESQVRNVPSYVGLVATSRPGISPQFWLSSEYTATTHDSRRLTWRLGNVRVRTTSRETGGMDRAAMTWSRSFENNYDALARTYPVFGELRNNMTFALVAALIQQENLLQRVNCNLTILLDETRLRLIDHPVPRTVEYRAVTSRNGFLTIVASGGVEINPVVGLRNNVRLDSRIDADRSRLLQLTGNGWWLQ